MHSYDDVIGDLDPEKLSRPDEFPRNFDVGFRRCRIAARMIVHGHDGMSRRHDGGTEHFPRVNQHLIENPDRDDLMPLHP